MPDTNRVGECDDLVVDATEVVVLQALLALLAELFDAGCAVVRAPALDDQPGGFLAGDAGRLGLGGRSRGRLQGEAGDNAKRGGNGHRHQEADEAEQRQAAEAAAAAAAATDARTSVSAACRSASAGSAASAGEPPITAARIRGAARLFLFMKSSSSLSLVQTHESGRGRPATRQAPRAGPRGNNL